MKEIHNYYVGIDIGSKGAISIINKEGKAVGYNALDRDCAKSVKIICNLIIDTTLNHIQGDDECQFFIVYEDVHSVFGSSKKSNFIFGFNKGVVQASIETLKYMLSTAIFIAGASPKVWQNRVWKDVDKIYKNNGQSRKLDTKATSLNAANRLFEGESFLATKKSRVPHDGIVDAILMADFAKNHGNFKK